MRNIFKILIPKEKAQEIIELQSFTVKWVFETYYDKHKTRFKSFIKIEDANEFAKQINESANFIGMNITTEIYQN